MLTAERMSKFRIVVPLEHKMELIEALSTFGTVSLRTRGPERVMPPLLQEILEGRISPENLDVEEALRVVSKVLREQDPLRKEFESLVARYRRLQKLKIILEKLRELGVSPEEIARPGVGLSTSCLCLREENLASALHELRRLGVIVRKVKISESEYFLLLLYPKRIEREVEEIKRRYMEESLALPEWFYGKPGEVEERISREEESLRREMLSILQEIASVIKDAIEFERASAHEIFAEAYTSITDLRRRLRRVEEIILYLSALKVAAKIYSERNMDLLGSLGVQRSVAELVARLLEKEFIETSEFEGKLCTRGVAPEFCKILMSEAERYRRFYLFYHALKQMEKEGIFEKAEGLWLLVLVGEPGEVDNFLSDAEFGSVAVALEGENREVEVLVVEGRYVNLDVLSIGGYKVAVLIADDEKVFNEVIRISERYDLLRYTFTPEELAEVEKVISNMGDNLERSARILVALLLAYSVIRGDIAPEKLIQASGSEELISLYGKLRDIVEGKLEPKLLPAERRLEAIKDLVDEIDDIREKIKELSEDVTADLELLAGGNRKVEESLLSKLREVVDRLEDVMAYEVTIEAIYRAQKNLSELRIFRNRRIVIAEGYVPTRFKPLFIKILKDNVGKIFYLKIRDISRPGEEAPTYIRHRGPFKYFYSLTEMLGTPSYWEIDPTPVFMILFITMYGMMFGDIGQGLVISLFGLWLYKTKYRLFGISEKGAQTLGVLAALSGLSAAVFGALYGCLFFLYPLCPQMAVIRPLHDIMEMIEVSLIFGVIQLFISFTFSTINHIRMGDYLGAVFGGTTLTGIVYYASGVYIVYKLSQYGFNLAALGSPEILPAVYVLLGALFAIVAYNAYKYVKTKNPEYIMETIPEIIEMMIAYPANSLSYIRLAAFAMAHEAFGVLAENLVPLIGFAASYLIANFFVFAIEALAVGIQSLRLLYYEFSTKFYIGTGIPFEPLVSTIEEPLEAAAKPRGKTEES